MLSRIRLDKTINYLVTKIYQHPFNRELYQGTLKPEIFNHFISQDILYLPDYIKTLTILKNRMSNPKHIKVFEKCITQTLEVVDSLKETYVKKPTTSTFFKEKPIEKISSIKKYTAHLLTGAKELPLPLAVARAAPCFLVYDEFSDVMNKEFKLEKDHPHFDWIFSYTCIEVKQSAKEFANILEDLADSSTPTIQEQMREEYKESTKNELMFLDEVYYGPAINNSLLKLRSAL